MQRELENMKLNKKRILVVDDEANITTLLRMLLERSADYQVQVENASTQALAVAEKFLPDLILLDVDMPGMDGGDLASRINESPTLRTVPIVFLTGAVTRQEVASSDGLIGGLPFLAKPANQAEVLGCLSKHIDPRAYLTGLESQQLSAC